MSDEEKEFCETCYEEIVDGTPHDHSDREEEEE